jgi:cell wall-associated NlpC family hydrolase
MATACGTFKPATTSTKANPAQQKGSSPRFIENITLHPGSGQEQAPPLLGSSYNSNGSNIFSINIEESNWLQFKYAVRMNVAVEHLWNLKLLQFIDEWYGTRYKYGGTSKQGVDCSGFSCSLLSAVFGLAIPRTSRDQYQHCEKIARDALQEGDLVFFNTRGGVSHVGVYLQNNKFVHASTSAGVIISDLNEDYYARRFLGGGRMRNPG